jgi:hypothetical protein
MTAHPKGKPFMVTLRQIRDAGPCQSGYRAYL